MKFFSNKKPVIFHDEINETVKVNVFCEQVEFDVSENGLNESSIIKADNWTIESGKYLTSSEREVVGFFGEKLFSTNRDYCFVYKRANKIVEKDQDKGYMALIDTKKNALVYKENIESLFAISISNKGYVFFETSDDQHSDISISVLDNNGYIFFHSNLNAAVDKSCFSDDGLLLAFTTFQSKYLDSNSLFVMNVEAKKIVNQTSLHQHVKKLYFVGNSIKCEINN